MKLVIRFVATLFIVIAALIHAEDAGLGKLTDESIVTLKEPNVTADKSKAAIAKVIDAVVPQLGVESEVARKDPQHQLDRLEFVVSRPSAEEQRAAYCATVAAKLGTELPPPAKIWLLKSLERISKAESVAAEVKLLADPDEVVRETARRALALNPAEESSAELRKALAAAADPKARIAYIEALGFKRNKADAPIFEKEAENADAGVKAAAIAALLAQGIRKQTGPVAEAAQLIDMGRAGNAADIPKLVAALDSTNVKFQQAAVQAVNLNASPEMTKALIEKLKAAPADSKAATIQILSNRGDKSTLTVVREFLGSGDAPVRGAAIQAIANLGDASTIAQLMPLAASGTGNDQRFARETLDRIRGTDVDKALVAYLTEENAEAAKEALQHLAARNAVTAAPDIIKLCLNKTGPVRAEGLKALGALGDRAALGFLVSMMVKGDLADAERDQAAKSVVAIAKRLPEGDDRAEPLVLALKDAPEPARIALLNALGQIGGAKASEAVHAAMKDANEKIQEAAFRALAGWPDATPMNELLELARTSKNETHRVLALRGFVRLVALPSQRAPKDSLALIEGGMDAIKTPDDRKLFLSALAEVKDPGAVLACGKFVADAGVTEEACMAVVKAAKPFESSHNEKLVPALKDVVAQTKNKATKDQAQALLNKLEKK